MARRLSIAFIAALLVAGAPPSRAATETVSIPGLRFEPATITIAVGDTVRWVNHDDANHTVTANSSAQAQGESFDSSPGSNCPPRLLFNNCLRPRETFSHTFTREGTFTYRCKIHGSNTSFANCEMCGRVIVRAAAPPPPPPPPPPASPSPSLSPTTSASPTTTSATPTGTVTSPGSGGGPSGVGSIPVIPIAAGAVALLGASGVLVYRSMLRR